VSQRTAAGAAFLVGTEEWERRGTDMCQSWQNMKVLANIGVCVRIPVPARVSPEGYPERFQMWITLGCRSPCPWWRITASASSTSKDMPEVCKFAFFLRCLSPAAVEGVPLTQLQPRGISTTMTSFLFFLLTLKNGGISEEGANSPPSPTQDCNSKR
jgi:hypothetical protein